MDMKIIDNRYKIEELISESLSGSLYLVTDLWNNDKKHFLKFYNYSYNKYMNIINYLMNEFIHISNIKHKNLLASENFKIVKSIDREKIRINQYYCITEYVDKPTLEEVHEELSLHEKLYIILQLCTVLDFLHFRGIVYKHLTPKNIYVFEDGQIKIKDLATINEEVIDNDYSDIDRFFIASEVLLKLNIVDEKADFYSLGMLIKYLFQEDLDNTFLYDIKNKNIHNLNDEQIIFLNNTIEDLTRKSTSNRIGNLKKLISDFNSYFSLDYVVDYREEREVLNFNTKIVGRENEIKQLLGIDKEVEESKYDTNLFIVEGEEGVGKTRFLKEINYILELKGREVYQIDIKEKENISLKSVSNVLRQMIKYAPKNLIDKYGSELIKIIPELRFIEDIVPSANLPEEKEKLRLYDRIANFVKDLAKEKPIYIIIDNIHNADEDTLRLTNYVLQSTNGVPLLFIVSYNEDKLEEKSTSKLIADWKLRKNARSTKLPKLGLYEIGDMVQHILGMNFRPLNFSTAILKETLGNPRYIELILQDLFAAEELCINENGNWNLISISYSDIYMPSDLDETLRKQLSLLENQALELVKIISIFNVPVSKSVILQMLNVEANELNNMIEKLVSMKLLDERLGDWGYSYTFYNMQLKKLLYHELDEEEKINLHKKASEVLENIYSLEDRENIDELIYHLKMSNQSDKAIDYLIKQAKKVQFILSAEALSLWEKANELLKDKRSELRLEVLENMGKLFTLRGENEKALGVYKEILNEAIEFNQKRYIVKGKNYMGDIYYRRNEVEDAFKVGLEAEKIAYAINYVGGILHSRVLLSKLYALKDNLDLALDEANQALELALTEEREQNLGYIYNQIGIIHYYNGNVELASESFKKSIEVFQNTKNYIEMTKPLNNMGTICLDYYGDDEKGIKCYDRALDICNKYGYWEMELVILNNTGETCMNNYEYRKARDYIEKSRNIAIDMEDRSMIFLTNVNLGEIYLFTGEYDSAFNCYSFLKEEFEKNPSFTKEIVNQYYAFLGNFYFKFGQWDSAQEYYEKNIREFKDFKLNYYLRSKSRIIIIDYLRDRIFDKDGIEEIRNEYREININRDRIKILTEFVAISILYGDKEYAYEILEEIRSISDVPYSDVLNNVQKFIIFSMKEDSIQYLMEIENKIKDMDFPELNLFMNYAIGRKSYSRGEYYKAINYYLESLDIMYRLVKKIPDKSFQKSYIESHQGDEIKHEIKKIFKEIFDIEVHCVYTADIFSGKTDIENYFDFKTLFDLIGDEDFLKIIGDNFSNNYIKDISNVNDLIMKFDDDYKHNLDIILRYLAKETVAQKGIIFLCNEENDEFEVIARLKDENISMVNESIINIVEKRKDGIVIKNTFGYNKNNVFEVLLSMDTKALICMPIIRREGDIKENLNERRRKSFVIEDKIVGYIYLETDRLFNRFDFERLNLVKSLSHLAFLNIENYNLKILSTIDKMTGIYTRKHFDTLFREILYISKKNDGKFSLLMLDIDKFKNINDTYGHRKGDEVLSLIGKTLLESTRSTDIVARYGGEEFIVVLLNTEEKEAVEIGEKIRKKIEELEIPNMDYPLTISIGISLYLEHSQYKEELIEKADQALYCAKEKGRNRVVLWDSNIANNLNRGDRLAGIISGNTVQDQRNVLAIMDVVDLLKKDITKEEKIYEFLGRIIETVDAEHSILILMNDLGKTEKIFARKRFASDWIKPPRYNKKIIEKAAKNKKGEFLIDWENIKDIDVISGAPNWQSTIVIPLVVKEVVKGIVYLTVPLREKEFDYNNYNLVNTICEVFSAVI